ncbi:MAG: 16S rRNA (uracil(1498)-N(3))-methyltransferase [Deltaproteobacteria bacterium]
MTRRGEIFLTAHAGPDSRHAIRGGPFEEFLKWRPRPGEAVTVLDMNGVAWRARVLGLGKDFAEVLVFEKAPLPCVVELTVLQALPEKERMELIIQKTTELGVLRIVPFKSEKSISLCQRESRQKKAHKWQDAALRASRQCRSSFITEVSEYASFSDAIGLLKNKGLGLMLLEKGDRTPVRQALEHAIRQGVRQVYMLCGPEAGFSAHEVKDAERAGFAPISLGQRILRTETASIVGAAIIMHELCG